MIDTISEYFDLRKKVFEHFDYVEDWVNIPLEDCRGYHWFLEGDGPGEIFYSEKRLTIEMIGAGDHYQSEIYTQRFLSKWVYRAEKYTMVCMDTRTDGNKFLGIFENCKEQPETLILYRAIK